METKFNSAHVDHMVGDATFDQNFLDELRSLMREVGVVETRCKSIVDSLKAPLKNPPGRVVLDFGEVYQIKLCINYIVRFFHCIGAIVDGHDQSQYCREALNSLILAAGPLTNLSEHSDWRLAEIKKIIDERRHIVEGTQVNCQYCRKPIYDYSLNAYRCYFCKSWLCPYCAKKHFKNHLGIKPEEK